MQPNQPAELSKRLLPGVKILDCPNPGTIVILNSPLIWELGQSNGILEIIEAEDRFGVVRCQDIISKYRYYYHTSDLIQPNKPPEFRPPSFMRTSVGVHGQIVAIRYILRYSKYEYLISDRKNKAYFHSVWVDQDDLVQDCAQGINND